MTAEKIEQVLNAPLTNTKSIVNTRVAEYIFLIVQNYYELPDNNFLKIKSRKREYVLPRQVAMYFLRKYTTFTQDKIGSFFNNKDHATVLYSERTINAICDINKGFKKDIEKLDSIIKFKSKAITNNIDIDKYFYYIDFENHTSLKLKDDKGVILSGFNENEIERIKEFVGNVIDSRLHENTGLYILEQIKK